MPTLEELMGGGKNYGPKFIKCGKKVLYPVAKVAEWEEANLRRNTI